MAASLDLDLVQSSFPALKPGFVFADNAGGSQVLQSSVDLVIDYLVNTNAQMGGGYPVGIKSEDSFAKAYKDTATFVGAASPKDIAFGSSTTALFSNLANSLRLGGFFKPGDEIVCCESDHEANIGAWVRLAKEIGCELKWWKVSGGLEGGAGMELSRLEEVVTPKTRLVAFTASSNILGQHTPIREVVDLVARLSEGKAKTVLDCVAYAPHALLDVQAWGVDFMAFSYYKVFAPHVSAMYVKPAETEVLHSLGHYFHPAQPSYQLAPGGASYELIASTSAVLPYISSLSGLPASAPARERLAGGWTAIQAHEQVLGDKLLGFLTSAASRAKGVRVIGPEGMGHANGRSALTVSFIVLAEGSAEPVGEAQVTKCLTSKSIVQHFDKSGAVGIKYGHYYATRLLAALGMGTVADPCTDGVVRVSLVHYNTVAQVDQIIALLKEIL